MGSDVNALGRFTLLMDEHPWKARSPMEETLLGIIKFSKEEQLSKLYSGIVVIPSGKVIFFNEEQSLNTFDPTAVTLLGMEISLNELHPIKASSSILITELGIETLTKLEHL